jgi:hypothetical protein
MHNATFPVRRSSTGFADADLVIGIAEAQAALATNALADARIAASANAATIAAQAAAGLATATSAQIADKAHAINTSGKSKGKLVYDTTADLMYFAIGTTDVAKWRLTGAVDATGDVTPS